MRNLLTQQSRELIDTLNRNEKLISLFIYGTDSEFVLIVQPTAKTLHHSPEINEYFALDANCNAPHPFEGFHTSNALCASSDRGMARTELDVKSLCLSTLDQDRIISAFDYRCNEGMTRTS